MSAICRVSLIVLIVLPLGLAGCSDARLIRTDPNGGVVAIPRNTNAWPSYNRKAAEELMKQKCPQGYVIDGEHEVVVGHTSEEQVSGSFHTVVNRPVTEWEISFHAVGTPPPMPPGVVPASASMPPAVVPASLSVPIKQPAATGLPPAPVPVGQ
jgi:hypothetical protein